MLLLSKVMCIPARMFILYAYESSSHRLYILTFFLSTAQLISPSRSLVFNTWFIVISNNLNHLVHQQRHLVSPDDLSDVAVICI